MPCRSVLSHCVVLTQVARLGSRHHQPAEPFHWHRLVICSVYFFCEVKISLFNSLTTRSHQPVMVPGCGLGSCLERPNKLKRYAEEKQRRHLQHSACSRLSGRSQVNTQSDEMLATSSILSSRKLTRENPRGKVFALAYESCLPNSAVMGLLGESSSKAEKLLQRSKTGVNFNGSFQKLTSLFPGGKGLSLPM